MLYSVELAPLFISMFFLACVVLWFAIKNHRNALLLGLVIPLTLATVVISYMSVDRILGYPINATIKPDSVYLSHLESPDSKSIYVWIVEPGSDKPRAVTILNTKNNKKQMQDAKNKTEEGIKQQMAPVSEILNEAEMKGRGMTKGGEFATYDFRIGGGSLKGINPRLGLPPEEDPDEEQTQNPPPNISALDFETDESVAMAQPVVPYSDLPEMPVDTDDATNIDHSVDEHTDF